MSAAVEPPLNACAYGTSGHCDPAAPARQHLKCAHNPGGAHEGGHEAVAAYLCVRTKRGALMVVADRGAAVWLSRNGRRYGHIWRCPCPCHSAPPAAVDQQLDLFGELVPA